MSSVPGSAFVRAPDILKIAEIYGGLPFLAALPDSPAEKAGLRWGDVVIAVNGRATPTADAFVQARSSRVGGATVRFVRDGIEQEVELLW